MKRKRSCFDDTLRATTFWPPEFHSENTEGCFLTACRAQDTAAWATCAAVLPLDILMSVRTRTTHLYSSEAKNPMPLLSADRI